MHREQGWIVESWPSGTVLIWRHDKDYKGNSLLEAVLVAVKGGE